MTLWIIMRIWIKKYVFLHLFSGTLPYRGEMRLCVLYPFISLCSYPIQIGVPIHRETTDHKSVIHRHQEDHHHHHHNHTAALWLYGSSEVSRTPSFGVYTVQRHQGSRQAYSNAPKTLFYTEKKSFYLARHSLLVNAYKLQRF